MHVPARPCSASHEHLAAASPRTHQPDHVLDLLQHHAPASGSRTRRRRSRSGKSHVVVQVHRAEQRAVLEHPEQLPHLVQLVLAQLATSRPATFTEPRSGFSSPTSVLRNTDLPGAEGPSMTETSPAGSVSENVLPDDLLTEGLGQPFHTDLDTHPVHPSAVEQLEHPLDGGGAGRPSRRLYFFGGLAGLVSGGSTAARSPLVDQSFSRRFCGSFPAVRPAARSGSVRRPGRRTWRRPPARAAGVARTVDVAWTPGGRARSAGRTRRRSGLGMMGDSEASGSGGTDRGSNDRLPSPGRHCWAPPRGTPRRPTDHGRSGRPPG